jgi:hypothetical protein
MPEIDFTDDDIDRLGRKLSGLDLDGTEKALMNAVLSLVANTMRNVEAPGEQTERSMILSDDDIDNLPDPGPRLGPALTPQTPALTSPFDSMSVRGTPIPLR